MLQKTIDALDRDARATTGLPLPEVDRRPNVDVDGTMVSYVGKYGMVGAVWSNLVDRAERAHLFVEHVQEFNGFTSWPECPLHPDSHPLRAEVGVDEVLVWTCPKEGAVMARVGDLPGPAGP